MKKLISLLLAIILLVSGVSVVTASAETLENIATLPLDKTPVNIDIATGEDVVYTFTVDTLSRFYYCAYNDEVQVNDSLDRLNMSIYSGSLDNKIENITLKIYKSDFYIQDNFTVLDAGTYYITLSSADVTKYSFCCMTECVVGNATVIDAEPNNTLLKAQKINENELVRGHMSVADSVDIYEFTLDKRQRVKLYCNSTVLWDPAIYYAQIEYVIYKKTDSGFSKVSLENCKYRGEESNSININGEWEHSVSSYLLDAGTYMLMFNYKNINVNDVYEFLYEAVAPTPSFEDFVIELKAGKTKSLTVNDGEVAKWKSSDKTVAKVKDGVVTGVKKGEATITAVLTDGTKLECVVAVTTNPTLKKDALTIKVGKTKNIKVVGAVGTVKYISKNTKIATVNKNGKVVAKAPGTTKIKVKVNGVKLTCKVNVKK